MKKIIYYSNTSHALKNTPIPILMKTEGNMSKKSGKKDQTHYYKKRIQKRMSDSAGPHAGWQLQTGCVGAG